MKTKTLAAIMIAATSITLISCDWLFHKKPSAKKINPIVGKWKFENIEDRSKNGLGIIVLSTPVIVEFKQDSTYGFFKNNKPLEDSGKYYLDSTTQTLFVTNNSSADDSTLALVIKSETDSSLQLFSIKDSVWYTLTKQ